MTGHPGQPDTHGSERNQRNLTQSDALWDKGCRWKNTNPNPNQLFGRVRNSPWCGIEVKSVVRDFPDAARWPAAVLDRRERSGSER